MRQQVTEQAAAGASHAYTSGEFGIVHCREGDVFVRNLISLLQGLVVGGLAMELQLVMELRLLIGLRAR